MGMQTILLKLMGIRLEWELLRWDWERLLLDVFPLSLNFHTKIVHLISVTFIYPNIVWCFPFLFLFGHLGVGLGLCFLIFCLDLINFN